MSGHMDNDLLKYDLGTGVDAFTTMRDSSLPYEVLTGHQVHGHVVAVIEDTSTTRDELDGVDALITDLPIAIGVRTADCIPVLLHDPEHDAVAAIHAGWKGTVQKIVLYTIREMTSRYGTDPTRLKAVIGPGISMDSFQVGEEVVQQFKAAGFPVDTIWRWDGAPREGSMNGGHHIDLKAANKWLLEKAGVPECNIMISGIDTYTDSRFFSARREGFKCGRNINAIRLTQKD